MPHRFSVEDHGRRNFESGHVTGTIAKVHTKEVDYMGRLHRCSQDDPQHEIKSEKTDHVAVHKDGAKTPV